VECCANKLFVVPKEKKDEMTVEFKEEMEKARRFKCIFCSTRTLTYEGMWSAVPASEVARLLASLRRQKPLKPQPTPDDILQPTEPVSR